MDVDSRFEWRLLASLYDEKTAHTLAALLNDELVPTRVTGVPRLVGQTLVWEINVPTQLLDRAAQLLAQSRSTDAENDYLATGVLRGDHSE